MDLAVLMLLGWLCLSIGFGIGWGLRSALKDRRR